MKEKTERTNIMDNEFGIKNIPVPAVPVSHKEKYWGNITTLASNDNFAIKTIFMKANTQSSMEYHVNKEEWYYIVSGKLKVGFRIGRAVNKSLTLFAGDIIHIPRGLMHMRIALEDTNIIEWSTKDDDSDSHIVEDGKIYNFKETE